MIACKSLDDTGILAGHSSERGSRFADVLNQRFWR